MCDFFFFIFYFIYLFIFFFFYPGAKDCALSRHEVSCSMFKTAPLKYQERRGNPMAAPSRCMRYREFARPNKADKSRGSKGLVSADRSEAAALLGTTPRSIPKSSASDFAPLSTAEGFPRSRARGLYSPNSECAGLGLVPSWR